MAKMTTERSNKLFTGLVTGALAMVVASGCQENETTYSGLQANLPSQPSPELPDNRIGITVEAEPSVVNPTDLALNRDYGVRSNPFNLLASEITFDRAQQTERLMADFGGWETFDIPADPVTRPVYVEPLPLWRLSGVIIGNGVLALLDTGSTVYEIRPGMTIPGTEWRVASIDDERAILVRDGNVLPHEFQVDLQGSISGLGGGGGNGGGGGGGLSAPGRGAGDGSGNLGVPGRGGR